MHYQKLISGNTIIEFHNNWLGEEDALTEFEKALTLAPNDPEIYFHMACAHSVLENARAGFDCLKKAVEDGLQDRELILHHDMLAFLRMHEAFDGFLNSGFTEYDRELLGENGEE